MKTSKTETRVHSKFHHLSEKYNIDIEKMGNIITDWEGCRERIKPKIQKMRSKHYPKVIQVQVPARFYWDEEGYDGIEFGPLDGCTEYQLKLFREILELLSFEHDCACVAEFMRERHKEEWQNILDMMEEELKIAGIPKSFLDAFKEKK